MNFLAHLFLSGDHDERRVGNFIADSVKGSMLQNYSPGICEGIAMHRAIDSFTDSHDVVSKSKERLRTRYKKYAPVIVDIFYDYFLATHWQTYANVSLRNYADKQYDLLKTYYPVFPVRTQQFYNYMVKYDMLFNYGKLDGIKKVMSGMANRASFISGMETAVEELEKNYTDFDNEFTLFFPQLQQHVNEVEKSFLGKP